MTLPVVWTETMDKKLNIFENVDLTEKMHGKIANAVGLVKKYYIIKKN